MERVTTRYPVSFGSASTASQRIVDKISGRDHLVEMGRWSASQRRFNSSNTEGPRISERTADHQVISDRPAAGMKQKFLQRERV
jgi:hypothetical protein